MGARMRAFDWDQHPLGNPSLWPESLKMNIRLLLNSGFPMFIWWSRELYMFHNDPYLPALGNKQEHALGASARVVWAEIWQDLGRVIDDILQGGNPFYADSYLIWLERKGFTEETYWTFSYSPAFDDLGQVNGVFCACSEVTATVLGERRLKSLKDLSAQMSQIQTLEQACQLTCDILFKNQRDVPFCMIYLLNSNASAATLIGRTSNLINADIPNTFDLTKTDQDWPLASVLYSQQVVVLDCRGLEPYCPGINITTGQNMQQVTQAAALPIMRPGHNEVIGFFIAGISPHLEYQADYKDFHALISGQIATSIISIQARQELINQQRYLNEIFQQAPVGIAIVRGPQHIIDLANPAVLEIWGRSAEETLGKPVLEALPEIADQGIIDLLDNVMHTGEPFIANELPIKLERHGVLETVYLNFIYHPMRHAQGLITGVIAVAIDISEQVKFRQSVEALNEELLATNADLDNFVYAASHDLKGPISNIEGLMTALIDDLPENTLQSPTIKQVITLIQSSINRFKKTLTDLTEVAKTQRQAGDDVDHVNLGEVVREMLLDFEPAIAESGARIVTDLDPEAVITFSAKNVRSIVYNLLSNALKYRSPERTPQITIKVKTTPDQVILSVQDNGLGINLEDESKMFSMFKRLHDHVEGSGVGLYIVKRIVENAGGSIKVESQVGVGSTFTITFRR